MATEPARSRIGSLLNRGRSDTAPPTAPQIGISPAGIPQVTVIVVNFNSGPYLARCLAALAAQTYRDFTVIVVDNASRDESQRALENLPAGWQALRLTENIGFAAANNRAIAMSGSPWIATLNPDAFAEPDWLAQLMRATRRYPDAAAFGSLQIEANRPDHLDGVGDAYSAAGLPWRGGFGQTLAGNCLEGDVLSPCAAAALYHREAVQSLGGFDEDFFCYGEDVDLGLRLRLSGQPAIQLANAVVRHVGGGSGGGQSAFARYHGVRNRFWIFVKNMPPGLFWPMLPAHLLMTAMLAVRSAIKGELPIFGRAIKDAFAGLPRVIAKRREIQAGRRGSLFRALSWSPLAGARRRPVVRLAASLDHLDPATSEGGVGVAMVSYCTGAVLFRAIDAVLADPTVERLVVVDNGNPPEDRASLTKRAAGEPRLLVIEGQGNVGFAAGCNLAARHLESDYLLLLNPDCVLPEGAIASFRAELAGRPRPALLGAVMVDEKGKVQRATRRNLPTLANLLGEGLQLWRLGWPRIEMEGDLPLATSTLPAISGAAMFLTLENYWALGGLDSGFFLHVEDLDLCARFHAAEGEVCLVPNIRIRHARSSSRASALAVEWHKTKGFRRYFRKHQLPGWQRPLMEAAIFGRLLAVAMFSPLRRRGSG
jgi:N-acetylglucosaminyl-diphospho-decaprenol L-rhamnosyltransferase